MMNPLSLCLFMVLISRCTAEGLFYPFGSAAGDILSSRSDDGSSPAISLLRSFRFFTRNYRQIFVNHNGHLTFNESYSQYVPYNFPGNSTRDIIAPFWTDLDNRDKGNISYQQYNTGDVLQRATEDINSYFPSVTFTATWVFVATWDRVAYFPQKNTETTFQVVLITDSNLSFVLMNYGDIASGPQQKVQIGYDTVSSTHYVSLRSCYPNNSIDIVNLNITSNINVQGRLAFVTTLQPTNGFICPTITSAPQPVSETSADAQPDTIIGLRLQVSSFENLNEDEIEEKILKPFGDLLKERGLNVSGIRLRRVYRTEP